MIVIETAHSTYEVDAADMTYRRVTSSHPPTERQQERQDHPDNDGDWMHIVDVLEVDDAIMFVYSYTDSGVAQGTITSSIVQIRLEPDDKPAYQRLSVSRDGPA